MRGSNREVSWPDTDRGPVPRDEKRPGDPPLYVSTPEHVTAHLLICMIALILMRIIQKRIRESGSVAIDPDAYWSSGLNAGRIQTALNKWKVDLLPGDLYRFMDAADVPDLKLIIDAFGIRLPPKLYRRAETKAYQNRNQSFHVGHKCRYIFSRFCKSVNTEKTA